MYFFASTLAMASVALAGLVVRQNNVPTPDVLYPHDQATAIWVVGVRHNVTWDATNVSGTNSKIWLAKGSVVDTSAPIASGFELQNGRVELTVPTVEPATDYTVLLDVNGQTASSAPFTIARSMQELPQPQPPASGVTTVVFPGTTIVTNLGAGATGSAPTPAPSAVSASVSSLASVAQSASSAASSIRSGISASATARPTASGAAPSGNSAVSPSLGMPTQVLVAIGATVFSAVALFAF